jgi:hypothetical protein
MYATTTALLNVTLISREKWFSDRVYEGSEIRFIF